MKHLWQWLQSWVAYRRLSAARWGAYDWERRAGVLQRRFAEDDVRLTRSFAELRELSDRLDRDLADGRALVEQQATVVESLRNENKVYGDTLIPVLTATCQASLAQLEAYIALETRKQVVATIRERE